MVHISLTLYRLHIGRTPSTHSSDPSYRAAELKYQTTRAGWDFEKDLGTCQDMGHPGYYGGVGEPYENASRSAYPAHTPPASPSSLQPLLAAISQPYDPAIVVLGSVVAPSHLETFTSVSGKLLGYQPSGSPRRRRRGGDMQVLLAHNRTTFLSSTSTLYLVGFHNTSSLNLCTPASSETSRSGIF